MAPIEVKLLKGKESDVVWGTGIGILLNEGCCDSIDTNLSRFPKYSKCPVRIVSPASANNYKYFYVEPELAGANLHDEHSNARRTGKHCDYCRSSIDAVDQVVIEEGSWKGSDLFEARGLPGILLASRALRDLAIANEWSNARFVPAASYSLSFL